MGAKSMSLWLHKNLTAGKLLILHTQILHFSWFCALLFGLYQMALQQLNFNWINIPSQYIFHKSEHLFQSCQWEVKKIYISNFIFSKIQGNTARVLLKLQGLYS
jgi:hypothetical protein